MYILYTCHSRAAKDGDKSQTWELVPVVLPRRRGIICIGSSINMISCIISADIIMLIVVIIIINIMIRLNHSYDDDDDDDDDCLLLLLLVLL